MKGEKSILKIPKTIKYKKEKTKERYYPYSQVEMYVGKQGSGKTLSAVKRIYEILQQYPKVTFISNVKIKNVEKAIYFKNCDELIERLMEIDMNNNYGYLIFIDEIHVVMADLFGKVDPVFLEFLSQQRKLSIHIIATAQLYNKLPKFVRDYLCQSGQLIACKNLFGIIQVNSYATMENLKKDKEGNVLFEVERREWFIHNQEMYEMYDTFAVISQIQNLLKGRGKNDNRLYNDI